MIASSLLAMFASTVSITPSPAVAYGGGWLFDKGGGIAGRDTDGVIIFAVLKSLLTRSSGALVCLRLSPVSTAGKSRYSMYSLVAVAGSPCEI